MLWRIYYEGGSTFDSRDGEPHDAPSFGVVAVVMPDQQVGRLILHGFNWYYWETRTRQWWGSDETGVHDGLLSNLPRTAYKLGRSVAASEFSAIMESARNDPDFPPKSGQRREERP